ncbi:MAG: TolC family protein, partial [Desulfomonilaceae bacterium]
MISFATRTVGKKCVSRFNTLAGFKIRSNRGLRGIILALIVGSSLFLSVPGAKAEIQIKPETYGYFDFPTCVRYALVHSDTLTQNRIDIQLASADLKDAHTELLPTVIVTTRYWFVEVYNIYNTGATPWDIEVQMTNWNPYLALLKIKTKAIMVDIAKSSHLDKISEATGNIATMFYGIHTLEKSLRGSKQILALVQDKLNFAKSKNDQGRIDPLELQGLQNDYRSQQIKVKSLENDLQEKTNELKALIGYHPDYYLPLDTRDSANQILNGLKSDWVTFTDVQNGNLQLKVSAKKEQMQSN